MTDNTKGMNAGFEEMIGLEAGSKLLEEPRLLRRRLGRFARTLRDVPRILKAGEGRLLWRDVDDTIRAHSVVGAMCFGRNGDCDLKTADASVSGRHFRIWLERDEWMIEDFQSTNGTRLNGARLDRMATLSPGDEIKAGQSTFYFDTFVDPEAWCRPDT